MWFITRHNYQITHKRLCELSTYRDGVISGLMCSIGLVRLADLYRQVGLAKGLLAIAAGSQTIWKLGAWRSTV